MILLWPDENPPWESDEKSKGKSLMNKFQFQLFNVSYEADNSLCLRLASCVFPLASCVMLGANVRRNGSP